MSTEDTAEERLARLENVLFAEPEAEEACGCDFCQDDPDECICQEKPTATEMGEAIVEMSYDGAFQALESLMLLSASATESVAVDASTSLLNFLLQLR